MALTELSETIAIFHYDTGGSIEELRFIGPFGVVGEWWNNIKEGLDAGGDPTAPVVIYGTGLTGTTTYKMEQNADGQWVKGDQLLQYMFQEQGQISLNGYVHTGEDVSTG